MDLALVKKYPCVPTTPNAVETVPWSVVILTTIVRFLAQKRVIRKTLLLVALGYVVILSVKTEMARLSIFVNQVAY
jgi:hypothetical protein